MIGKIDSQVLEKFKVFQEHEKGEVYRDLDLGSVEFEYKKIHSDEEEKLICTKRMGFTPKRDINGSISWFTVRDLNNIDGLYINQPDTKEKTTMGLIKQSVDKNNTGKSEKLIPIKKNDILVSFKLSVGVTKIYNSDEIAYCNEAIDILTLKEGYNSLYVANLCILEYPKHGTRTNNGITLNDDSKEDINIPIPKPQENFTSYDIQKAIVDFLEFWKIEYTEVYRKKIGKIKPMLETMKQNLISSTFALDSKIVESFNEFAKNEGFDVILEEIEFKKSNLGTVINLNGGDRITKKNDTGSLYPVYGGGGESFKTDTYNRENEYVIGRFAISLECVRFVNTKFHLLDSGFTFKIKDSLKDDVDKDFVGYFLLASKDKIFNCAKGSGQKNLDTKLFNKIDFTYPNKKSIQNLLVSYWEMRLGNFEKIKKLFDRVLELCDKIDETFLYRTFSKIKWSK